MKKPINKQEQLSSVNGCLDNLTYFEEKIDQTLKKINKTIDRIEVSMYKTNKMFGEVNKRLSNLDNKIEREIEWIEYCNVTKQPNSFNSHRNISIRPMEPSKIGITTHKNRPDPGVGPTTELV
jgi:archaellum component FlaC